MQKLKLKDLLLGTGALLVLTVIQLLRDFIGGPSYRVYQDGLRLLLAWVIAVVVWTVYLVGVIRSRKPKKEEEPWDRKEKDPC